jgi:hypothetical protein
MKKEENAMEQNNKIVEQNKPDWSIDELYRSAWRIVKNNKVLWLFGMAIGAGGMSGNYRSSFDNSDLDGLRKLFQNSPNGSSELSSVLGASTNSFSDTLGSIFSAIPTYFYFLLGLEFLIMVILGVIASLIYSSWAHAALLEGIQTASGNGKLTIRELSEKAFGDLKAVMYVQYVPYLIITAVSIIIFLALAIPSSFFTNTSFIPLLLILLPFSILGVIFFILTLTWAIRIVVYDKKTGRQSLSLGFKIAKKKFWASLLLGLVNSIAIGILYVIIMIPFFGLFFGGIFAASENTNLATGLIIIGVILLLIFILGFSILGGIIESFKATVWSLAYNNIRGKYEK